MDKEGCRLKNAVAVIGALCAMLCLILAPTEAIESARYGLSLCAELILPSLLPFFAASALLVRLGVPQALGRLLAPLARRLWGVSGAGAAAFLTGICGGYPLGAQTVAELYANGQVTKKEGESLLRFCNNSGPSFLVGVIGGGLFSSRGAGLLLYAIHVCAALTVGVLFRARAGALSDSAPAPTPEMRVSEAIVASVRQAVAALLSVCGFVVCFCVLAGLLDALGLYRAASALLSRSLGMDARDARALLTGLLELSGGVGALRGLPPTAARFVLSAFLSGWGGLCVQFQSLAVLADTDLSARPLITGRLFCALISALLAFALCGLVPLSPASLALAVFS